MCERDRKQLSSKPVTFKLDALLGVIFISLRQLLTEATLLLAFSLPVNLFVWSDVFNIVKLCDGSTTR